MKTKHTFFHKQIDIDDVNAKVAIAFALTLIALLLTYLAFFK